MSAHSDAVIFSIEGPIASLRLNRPEKLNSIDPEIARGFEAAVDAILAAPQVKVIVISAEGRAFVAGGDLAFFRLASDRAAAADELVVPMHNALKRLHAAPQIVIGSVKGAVAGAGLSIALGVDLLVAADDARFNMAYARVAASPDCGGSWALPRIVGLRKALEIVLLSETVDATEAQRLGIVNRMVPLASLEAETASLAARLAAGPALAQANIKALLQDSLMREHSSQLDTEAGYFSACAVTRDFDEAINAFFDKRVPRFS